jgi:aminoglycoside phosphotransferase (APT) family kinase protein
MSRVADLTRLGGGREAEVFAWGDGQALRLAHDPGGAARVEREALALAAAHAAGAPVPAVYGRVTIEGRPGAIVQRVDGPDLLTMLGRRPWLVLSIGRSCGALHARLHELLAPAELPSLTDEMRERLQSGEVPADVRDAALAQLEQLPDGDRLCHGDFHPANVLDAAGGRIVIDWTLAARGHPAADVARTRLLLLGGVVPDYAPLLVRRLDRLGRRMFFGAYLRGYGRVRGPDPALVQRWEHVCAAARLSEGIDAEREALLMRARRLLSPSSDGAA